MTAFAGFKERPISEQLEYVGLMGDEPLAYHVSLILTKAQYDALKSWIATMEQ